MIILGIDPGYGIVGFGIIEKIGSAVRTIDYGVIKTPPSESLPARLAIIYEAIESLVKKHQVDQIAIEEIFFCKNAKTAIAVSQARGAIVVACVYTCGQIYEYTPLQVKQALTGHGRAEKQQVEFMVKARLGIKEKIRPDDASDALAVALCHAQTNQALQNTSFM